MLKIPIDNKFLKITFKVIRNKFFIASTVFFIYLLLLSQNNLIDKFESLQNLHKLKKEKQYYINDINATKCKLYEIRRDKRNVANIEKFAREQYLMKKDNEDIYLIIEEAKK